MALTDRNSTEKACLKYPTKAKLKQINHIIGSFNLKSNSKERKTQKSLRLKKLYSYKDTLKSAYHQLNKDLRKYNFSHIKYNTQKSDEIIFAKNKRLVSLFKDSLLWNETSDFLKQFYKIKESRNLIPNMCEYYECFSLVFPEYAPLEDLLKKMKKFMKKKQLIFQKYEEIDEKSILNRNYVNIVNSSSKKVILKNNKINFQKIINEKDINKDSSKTSKTYSHSKTCLNYKNEIDDLKNLSAIVSDF